MASCTHRERIVVDRLEVPCCSIAHTARSEIHKARLHTDERESHIVEWHVFLIVLCPFCFFHTEATLKIDDIGISSVNTCWFVDAVIVEHEVVLCTNLSNAVYHFHTFLVVSVEKIHLETCNSHVGICLANLFKIVVEDIKDSPKNDSHTFLFSIRYKLRQIQFGNHRKHVVYTWFEPTFIEDDIRKPIFCCKVYIIFIGVHVNARCKIHSAHSPVVPPIPCHLSWFYPRGIANAIGRSQSINEIIDRHFGIVVTHCNDTPR